MAAAEKILIVEDERDIADLMSLHLKREGHLVDLVEDGEEALKLLHQNRYRVLLLDWMLPGLSGLELCKKLRAANGDGTSAHIPILMVTARAHSSDIVLGLEMGADDYLTKPFEIPVFLARVRALLRRSQFLSEDSTSVFKVGQLAMDVESHRVTCGSTDLVLTPSEFKLLLALMKCRGRVLTRQRLIDLVQGEGVTVIDRTVDTHVFGLRKKLGECADVVETIRGVGYRVKTEL